MYPLIFVDAYHICNHLANKPMLKRNVESITYSFNISKIEEKSSISFHSKHLRGVPLTIMLTCKGGVPFKMCSISTVVTIQCQLTSMIANLKVSRLSLFGVLCLLFFCM